jgi:hypothetical protein
MSDIELTASRLEIRVVREDLPDMIEVEAQVVTEEWAGVATGYVGPDDFRTAADGLRRWADRPAGEHLFEIGADTGIGWVQLRWVAKDGRGVISCHVRLATNRGDPQTCWRLGLTLKAEPWAVQRFAASLTSVARSFEGGAVLKCLPDDPR